MSTSEVPLLPLAASAYLSKEPLRIASLEKTFDTLLLDRVSKKIVPTKAGKLFYYYAKRMLGIKREMLQAMDKFLGVEKGELIIGGSTIPGTHIMPGLIGKFRGMYPGVNVILKLGDSEEIVNGIESGVYELGIVGSKPDKYEIACIDFEEDTMIPVVNGTHKWAKNEKEIPLEALMEEPFVMREVGSGTRKIIENILLQNKKNPDKLNVVCELGSSEAVKQGVLAGIGVSIISRREVENELKQGLLKEVKIKNLKFDRKFYLIYHERRPRSPVCETFLEFILKPK